MYIDEEYILNYLTIDENQINTKKQIIDEFINYKNDYNYLKDKNLHKFIFEENGDEYIHANLNSAKYTLHPFSYQKITDEHRNSIKIVPRSLSKEIFEPLLEPIGWKREELQKKHYTFTLNGKKYTHVEVIEIVKQLLISSPEKAKLIPKSSPFRKIINPICNPISNKWINVSGYHEFFKLETIVDKETQLELKSSLTQFIREYSHQEYSEIKNKYFIKVGKYIEPSPGLSIMKNIIKNEYKYVDKSKIIGQTCVGCKTIKNNDEFSSNYVTYCKSCSKISGHNYRDTIRGKFLSLYRDIKNDIRFTYTPEKPLITFTEFLLQYINQGGMCAYSGKPLLIKTHDDKTISRERINNKKGYINGNIVFVFKIFNVSPGNIKEGDWSVEKINKMKDLIHKKINLNDLILLTEEIKKNKQGNQGKNLPGEDQIKRQDLGEIEWKKYYHNRYSKEYRKSPKGFILGNITSHNIYDTEKFGRKGDLTLDSILDLLVLQNGRCCISNVPLNLIQTGEFVMSIDRIDNTKPHDINNIRLVCKEFNCWNNLHWTKELFGELFN